MKTFEDQMPGFSFSDPFEYSAILHCEDGSYWIEVDQMPGCFASGDTQEELIEALTEAMSLYLSSKGMKIQISNLQLVPGKQFDHSEEVKILVGA